MGKIGKISTIKKSYPGGHRSLEASLSESGYDRFPGTYEMVRPFKELTGKYRTGLDPDAAYLQKYEASVREIMKKEILETKQRLEAVTGLDLGPRSTFYNQALKPKEGEPDLKAKSVKLYQGDNIFNFDDPMQEISFRWLSVHPQIATSFRDYERGNYPPQTQWYVNNEDIEGEQTYNKKVQVNKAVAELEEMAPEKKRKIARLLGLPISDNTKESKVYNLLDSFIKQTDIKEGTMKGQNPVVVFNKLVAIDNKLLHVKDLVEQAITHSIYRVGKAGRIHEGNAEIFKSKDELVEFLFSDKGQEDLLALEDKLNTKKSTMVVQ